MIRQEPEQVRLRVLRVQRDLIYGRFDLTVCQHVCEQLRIEVRDPDCLGKAYLFKILHLGPENVHGHFVGGDTVGRPMNEIQVDIIKTKFRE